VNSADHLVTLCIRAYGWLPTVIDGQPAGPILTALG